MISWWTVLIKRAGDTFNPDSHTWSSLSSYLNSTSGLRRASKGEILGGGSGFTREMEVRNRRWCWRKSLTFWLISANSETCIIQTREISPCNFNCAQRFSFSFLLGAYATISPSLGSEFTKSASCSLRDSPSELELLFSSRVQLASGGCLFLNRWLNFRHKPSPPIP